MTISRDVTVLSSVAVPKAPRYDIEQQYHTVTPESQRRLAEAISNALKRRLEEGSSSVAVVDVAPTGSIYFGLVDMDANSDHAVFSLMSHMQLQTLQVEPGDRPRSKRLSSREVAAVINRVNLVWWKGFSCWVWR